MRIAVVGAGIAGLTAAYRLGGGGHEVHLFEAGDRPGGHCYTVPVEEEGRTLWIDMGFIVYNERTYPRFTALLDELGVATRPSEMSLSVRCEKTGLEYNGSTLNQLFAQRRNLLNPRHYRMIAGILRFHRAMERLVQGSDDPTLGELLERWRLRGAVVERYILPMTGAIWSTPERRMLDYPARTLATFLRSHGMLTVDDRPQWRTVSGGSRCYVERLVERLSGPVHLGTPVAAVRREPGVVEIELAGGDRRRFDQVVIATHSDQALRLLADADEREREILGAIAYQDNEVVLHTDRSFLPRRRRARAAWNAHLNAPADPPLAGNGAAEGGPTRGGVKVTYSMNILQRLDARREYLVTLNRGGEIDPAAVLHRTRMAHPLYDRAAVAAQQHWGEISGVRGTHFCGAYWRYGFHEDGVWSGERVVDSLLRRAAA